MRPKIPPELFKLIKDINKDTRIKECLHPDKNNCSERIIKAHSIQDNKILSKFTENGEVFMGEPKNDFSHIFGHKEASTFTGFCGYHDKVVFQPIEDFEFDGSQKHVFLHIYRAFALAYMRKREAVLKMKKFIDDDRCLYKEIVLLKMQSFEMSVNSFERDKVDFDKALLNNKYDILSYLLWVFPEEAHFAANGFEALPLDFDGNFLQDITDPEKPAQHIYISIFPENGKTYCIIAWLKFNNKLFAPIYKKLNGISKKKRIYFINNTVPISTENFVLKPSSWDKFPDDQKNEFLHLYYGGAEDLEIEGKVWNRFKPTRYDLFKI